MTAPSYFVTWKGRRDGPYTLDQLAHLLHRGDLSPLHSVETAAGPVTLRQLLQEADPARWSLLTGGAATATAAVPVGGQAPVLPSAPPPPMMATRPPTMTDEPPNALEAYVVCGLSFALPPLLWLAWRQARACGAQGYGAFAAKIRQLAGALAGAGVLFWLVVAVVWRRI